MSEVATTTEVEPKQPPAGQTATEVPPETKAEEKKRTYDQDEVDRILAKVRKNERYRTRKEVEAYYKGLNEGSQPVKRETPPEDREPVRADFSSYEEYLEARTDYRARKASRDETAKVSKESEQRQAQEREQKAGIDFQKKVMAKFPNIQELIEDVGDMPMYRGVQAAIMESELGPEIFNDLLQNPKEFERLASLTEAAAIREIGKLEARLEAKAGSKETPSKAEQQPELKQASKAPAPITPPGGATAAVSGGPSDTDDINTWMAKERARTAKRPN